MKFVIIPELKGFWVWELRGKDGVAIARSPGRFAHKAEAVGDIKKVRVSAAGARIFDLVGTPQEEDLTPVVRNLLQAQLVAQSPSTIQEVAAHPRSVPPSVVPS